MTQAAAAPSTPAADAATKKSSSSSNAPLRGVDYLTGLALIASVAACLAFDRYKPFQLQCANFTESMWVAAASFLTCSTIMFLCPRSLSFESRSRVVSTIHAVVSTYLAWVACLEMKADPRFDLSSWFDFAFVDSARDSAPRLESLWLTRYPAAHFAVAVTWGYIAYDSSLLFVDSKILDWAMKIHHGVALFGFGTSLLTGFATPYMALVLVNEASTPFVNNHYTWAKSGLLRSLNGSCMWLSYASCRLVLNSIVLVHILTSATQHVRESSPKQFWGYLSGFLAVQREYAMPPQRSTFCARY